LFKKKLTVAEVHGLGWALVPVEHGERDGGAPLLSHQLLCLLPAQQVGTG